MNGRLKGISDLRRMNRILASNFTIQLYVRNHTIILYEIMQINYHLQTIGIYTLIGFLYIGFFLIKKLFDFKKLLKGIKLWKHLNF